MRKKRCGDYLLGYDLLQPSRLDNMLIAQSGLGLAPPNGGALPFEQFHFIEPIIAIDLDSDMSPDRFLIYPAGGNNITSSPRMGIHKMLTLT